MSATASPLLPSTTTAAAVASTPSRRANVPAHIKDWIFSKACLFQYYEDGARTKEERQLFIVQLAKKLNARYGGETGAWDEARTGTQVRNLKKERLLVPSAGAAACAAAPSAPPPPTKAAPALRPVEQLLLDWQAALTAASRLNGNTLARHSSNRGACNEDLLRGFLASVLGSSRYIGIGCGEVLQADDMHAACPRQVDIVLYNTEYPCLQPARFGAGGSLAAGGSSGCACFYRESVMAVIEVKTTLTNQDLRDVANAASLLSPLPFLVFAFDSQTSLKAIDMSVLPDNVAGVYTLSHGSVVRHGADGSSDSWRAVHPSKQAPLAVFYASLLDVLARYAGHTLLEPLQRVVDTLRKQLPPPGGERTTADDTGGGDVRNGCGPAASATNQAPSPSSEEGVLRAIDLNRLTIHDKEATAEHGSDRQRAKHAL